MPGPRDFVCIIPGSTTIKAGMDDAVNRAILSPDAGEKLQRGRPDRRCPRLGPSGLPTRISIELETLKSLCFRSSGVSAASSSAFQSVAGGNWRAVKNDACLCSPSHMLSQNQTDAARLKPPVSEVGAAGSESEALNQFSGLVTVYPNFTRSKCCTHRDDPPIGDGGIGRRRNAHSPDKLGIAESRSEYEIKINDS